MKAEFIEYNLSRDPVRFPAVQRFAELFAQTERYNQWRPLAARRLLIVNGGSFSGKTTTVLAEAVRQAHQAGMTLHDNGRVWPVPWVYVVASPTGGGRALVKSIADFLAVPVQVRNTAQDIVNRLSGLMKPIGVRAILIDDAHFLRTQGAKSNDVAHILKHLITCLPVTIVLAGVNLHEHAITNAEGGDLACPGAQIRSRSTWLEIRPWEQGSEDGDVEWGKLMMTAKAQLAFPREKQWGLNTVTAGRAIQERCGSRASVAMEWIVQGSVVAIERDVNLTANLMNAVARDMPALTKQLR